MGIEVWVRPSEVLVQTRTLELPLGMPTNILSPRVMLRICVAVALSLAAEAARFCPPNYTWHENLVEGGVCLGHTGSRETYACPRNCFMTGTKCVVSDSRPTLPCSKAAVTRRKKYRALVLVLASDSNALFKMFKSVWEQMMFTEPDVGIFFVYGGKEVALTQPWDLVFRHIPESYPVRLHKVYEAFALLDRLFDYDFMVRTNLSTFWVLGRLLRQLDRLPTKLCYVGDGPLPPWRAAHERWYLSGTDTIVNRYMITSLVQQRDKLNWHVPEDDAMGQFFHIKLGAPLVSSNMHFMEHLQPEGLESQISSEIASADALGQSHFRIKSRGSTSMRTIIDGKIARALLQHYYNRTI